MSAWFGEDYPDTPKAVKPISPGEIAVHKAKVIPSFVFEAFNELIAAEYVNGRATIIQKDVVALIKDKMGLDQTFNINWLNVEEAYKEQGWHVIYDKPAYNESYDASFIFKAK